MIKSTKLVHNVLAYDKTLQQQITEELKYENQYGDAVCINIDIPDVPKILLVTATKRGNLELHFVHDWHNYGVLTINLYDIQANDQEYPTTYIKTLEDTAQYRDGGITTDEKVLGKIVYDEVIQIINAELPLE